MASNSDDWIADVMTFVRNSWGHQAGRVKAEEIAQLRKATAGRTTPWTQKELRAFDPVLRSRALWKLTASHNGGQLHRAIDDLSLIHL